MTIIASPAMLAALRRYGSHVFIDGTWNVADGRLQLVVIWVATAVGKIMPCALCITNAKDAAVYAYALQVISECAGWVPTHVFTDFEKAIWVAVGMAFVGCNVLIWGCLWHFTQAVRRHLENSVSYTKADINVIMQAVHLAAYAYDKASFDAATKRIKSEMNNRVKKGHSSSWKYFQDTWMGQMGNRGWNTQNWALFHRVHSFVCTLTAGTVMYRMAVA